MAKRFLYWDWVRLEAARISSDGCTLVSECFHDACLQHDLAYFHGKNPTAAYKLYMRGIPNYWEVAVAVGRKCADRQFRDCIRSKSPLGRWSVMGFVRYMGVRAFGWKPWRAHRARQ